MKLTDKTTFDWVDRFELKTNLRFELPATWKEQAMLLDPKWNFIPRPTPWKLPMITWVRDGRTLVFQANPMQSLVAHAVIETIHEIRAENRHPSLIVMPVSYWGIVCADLPFRAAGFDRGDDDRELFGIHVELTRNSFYVVDDRGEIWE